MTDIWAIGCIYAELLSLRPIFKGDEAKLDSKKTLPFQRDQMGKICDVLGPVKRERQPSGVPPLLTRSRPMAWNSTYAGVQDVFTVGTLPNFQPAADMVSLPIKLFAGIRLDVPAV